MKRLFLALALLVGGICVELARPASCSLIADSRARERKIDGETQ